MTNKLDPEKVIEEAEGVKKNAEQTLSLNRNRWKNFHQEGSFIRLHKSNSALLTLCKELLNPWEPIEKAPKDEWLLVKRPSGHNDPEFEYLTGMLHPVYRDEWIDVDRNRFSDSGEQPTHFMHKPKEPR